MNDIDRKADRAAAQFRVLFLLLLLLAFLGNGIIPRVVNRLAWLGGPVATNWGFEAAVLIGAFFMGGYVAQLAGLGTWMTFGSGSWTNRYLIALVGAFTGSVILLIGVQYGDLDSVPVTGYLTTGIGSVVVTCLVSWLLRIPFVSCVVLHKDHRATDEGVGPKSHQFSTQFLLATMSAVAFLCILVRFTFPKNDRTWIGAQEYVSMVIWFGWFALGVSLVAALAVRCLLGAGSILSWIAFGLLVILGPLIIQWVSSTWIFRPEWGTISFAFDITWQNQAIAYLMEFGIVLFLVIALLATRWIGFRLVLPSSHSSRSP